MNNCRGFVETIAFAERRQLAAAERVYVEQRMKRVFGLETEFGITVDGMESVDVVAESIELVRGYTEHGALDEMGLRSRGSAPGRARFSREGTVTGHGRSRPISNGSEPARSVSKR